MYENEINGLNIQILGIWEGLDIRVGSAVCHRLGQIGISFVQEATFWAALTNHAALHKFLFNEIKVLLRALIDYKKITNEMNISDVEN